MTSTYLTRLAAALDGAGTDPDTLARIAAGVSRWEPIETAQKCVIPILCFWWQGGAECMAILSYYNGFGAAGWHDAEGSLCDPTHWQPLPEPPTEETKK